MTPSERKTINENKLREQGIAINQWLPLLPAEEEAGIRSFDEVCGRAVASLLIIQLAIDTANGQYDEGFEVIGEMLDKFGVKGALNTAEKEVFDGSAEEQTVMNVAWEYECYWSLVWALGLIGDDDLHAAEGICDCERAINLVSKCDDMQAFKAQCKMRSAEDILAMADYFYRLHWACVEHRLNPETPVGDISEEVVMDRRRGLEWLIGGEDDWFDISLDT